METIIKGYRNCRICDEHLNGNHGNGRQNDWLFNKIIHCLPPDGIVVAEVSQQVSAALFMYAIEMFTSWPVIQSVLDWYQSFSMTSLQVYLILT